MLQGPLDTRSKHLYSTGRGRSMAMRTWRLRKRSPEEPDKIGGQSESAKTECRDHKPDTGIPSQRVGRWRSGLETVAVVISAPRAETVPLRQHVIVAVLAIEQHALRIGRILKISERKIAAAGVTNR